MAQKIIQTIIYILKELLGQFIGQVGTPGTLVDTVTNNVAPSSFTDQVKAWCQAKGYPFDPQFMRVQVNNPANPNTFNDWGLMFCQGKWVKWRNTSSGGKWTAAQKKKYNISWVAAWEPGYYPDCFALTRDGATEFTRLGMPAFHNFKNIPLRNLETGEIQMGRNCDEHGRRGTSEWVGLSSAGCLTTFIGKMILKVVAFFKTSQLYHRDGLKSTWGIHVADINDFPSIKGVKSL